MIFDRLVVNEKMETFIPKNVEAAKGQASSKFWTTNKGLICCILAILYGTIGVWAWGFPILPRIIILLVALLVCFVVINFLIIETPYFKKALQRQEQYKMTSAGINYGIMYHNERENGTSVGFVDGYIGVFVSLTRDSVVGRPENYQELCEEAFSNFLKDAHDEGYSVVKCNVMEVASKDKRLITLRDDLKYVENNFVRNILSLNLSEIYKAAENAYYDQDILLIYTMDSMKLNRIIDDALRITAPLLQAGFLKRRILNEADTLDLHTEIDHVGSFNSLLAKNEMFENIKTKRKFDIVSLKFKNGNELILSEEQKKKLYDLYTVYIHNKDQKIDIMGELMDTKKVVSEDNGPSFGSNAFELEEFVPIEIMSDDNEKTPNVDKIETQVSEKQETSDNTNEEFIEI